MRGRALEPDRGFTLIELAVVVFVIGLILGGILVPLSSQVEQRQVAEAQRQLDIIRDALIGYALANGHLPCPDKTSLGATVRPPNDGQEDFDAATGICDNAGVDSVEGNIPWATLGVPASDPWGNRYRYRVTETFAKHPPASLISLITPGSLQVCSRSSCAGNELLSVSPPALNSPVAVVLSHGPTGLGAMNADTGTFQPAPTSADEVGNMDGNNVYVSRPPTVAASTIGEFDDIVIWLSPHTLKNRLVAAGKLP